MEQNIILIDDRPERRKKILGEELNRQLEDSQVIHIPDVLSSKQYFEKLNSKDISVFNSYKTIMIHKSPLNRDGLSVITDYCAHKNISLVFFSGSLSQIIYKNDFSEVLSLNSSDLYTTNLINYLEHHESSNILELAYGKKYEFHLFINYRNIVNSIIKDDQVEESKLHLEDLHKIIFNETIDTMEALDYTGYSKMIQEKIDFKSKTL